MSATTTIRPRDRGTVSHSPDPWNANIHYDATLDAQVPRTARSVLDVGCRDGFLAARLAHRVPRTVGLDVDGEVLRRARGRFPTTSAAWCQGDLLHCPLRAGTFDAVVSNAALHHFPETDEALRRLAELVTPGGTLAIVGFTRVEWQDVPWALAAFVSLGVANRLHRKWEHSAPQSWPPPHTYRQLRRTVHTVLPGAQLRRLLMGRYLITWRAA
jgi:ubiquinone/menaquinone biosynthesis C-methylase UbiE